jgi:alkanesulfonate monooxygenase SsuD/methylene tetrahydromethanopterin reductase-like flavin-dependent oxidoreductase (luciferase family)
MKIDLLYELQNPHPEKDGSEYENYWEAIEQIELADRMGFDTVWAVEHHFLTGFAHSSAPEVFLSAVAQRTERIRIGHGVVLLPSPFNHPIRVAERIGALDILSKGRVEFGTGRSSLYEQNGFEVPVEESRAMWQEAVEIIPKMWATNAFSHHGRFWNVPERDIIPKPIQKPHPPMWMAATSPESWELAGRNGLGVLGLTIFVSVKQIAERIAVYREAVRGAVPVGASVHEEVGAFTVVHCAETQEQAIANGGTRAAVDYLTYAFKVFAGGFKPGSDAPDARPRDKAGADAASTGGPYQDMIQAYPLLPKMMRGEVTYEDLDQEDMVIVGDVDKCIRKIERYQDVGVDRVLCLMQGGEIPHAAVMQSIELFGKHVIPHFDQ